MSETTAVPTQVKWTIDKAHSEVSFKVKHLMITNVKGIFRDFDASIYTTDEDFLTAEIDFWIDASSVFTADEARDNHLRSADFFDAEHHKQIHFTGNTFEKVDNDGSYTIYGDLTIKGIKHQVKLRCGVRRRHEGSLGQPQGRHSRSTATSTARTGASTGTRPWKRAACS